MNHVDYKYIQLIGSRLNLFKCVGNDVYSFRCPVCKDSKKKENKKRGFIFGHDNPRFLCHNCGASSSLPNFIKYLDPTLFLDYKLERFSNNDSSKKNPTIELDSKFINKIQFEHDDKLLNAFKLSSHNASPIIIDYAFSERKIPRFYENSLYSINNINDMICLLEKYKTVRLPNVPALLIPFYHQDRTLDWIQCRILHSSFRFITLNVSDNENTPKIWGLEYINWNKPVYITEGPIDAMCLNNALAIAGASSNRALKWIKSQAKDEIIFCYDNDYSKNKEIKNQLLKRIEEGYGVVLYDKKFKWKDINEAIQSGMEIDTLNRYIEERTFFNIKAKLNLSFLKSRGF
jgi:hypothetical protein